MKNQVIKRIKTISQYHKLRELSSPDHPLISVIDFATIRNGLFTVRLKFLANTVLK
jgi:hypothetical protein